MSEKQSQRLLCKLCYTVKNDEDIMIEHLAQYHKINKKSIKNLKRLRGGCFLYEPIQ